MQYTDVLFDGIDNMSADLSYSDCKTVNEMRREYLQNFFSDNLKDTICDNRELQYARVLYNLQEPDSSIMFLYPNRVWTDHLFWILSTEACGMYDEANRALQLFHRHLALILLLPSRLQSVRSEPLSFCSSRIFRIVQVQQCPS